MKWDKTNLKRMEELKKVNKTYCNIQNDSRSNLKRN